MKLIEPRYEEFTEKVTIAAGKTTVLSQDLKALPEPKPPFGMLRTDGGGDKDQFAAVFVNDHYMGHVDEFSNFAQRLLMHQATTRSRSFPQPPARSRTKR